MEFKKTETVRHLGLLDLQRTMQRCLRRTQLPLAYSKGFNPHIQMSFASALSSGIPGEAELLDVALDETVGREFALEEMKKVLPDALPVNRIRMVEDRFPKAASLVKAADYQITFLNGKPDEIFTAIPSFMKEKEILVMKKSKSGEKLTDIRPMIYDIHENVLSNSCSIRVAFREGAALRPDLLYDTLCKYADVSDVSDVKVFYRRQRLLTETQAGFISVFDYMA